MEAVEAAVHPTLERVLAEHGTTVPMAAEHLEIRRLVGALGRFADEDQAAGAVCSAANSDLVGSLGAIARSCHGAVSSPGQGKRDQPCGYRQVGCSVEQPAGWWVTEQR